MDDRITSQVTGTFKQETVQKLLRLHFTDEKTKISNDALLMVKELLKLFVMEGAMRAIQQAQKDSATHVTIDHFERILPQLMLDLS